MQISNNVSVSPIDTLRGASRSSSTTSNAALEPSSGTITPVDQLDLSAEAQGISDASSTESKIRVDRVSDIRRQIADGSYETDEKLSAALDNFLNQLG
ncbi:MAG: flagellar biosynthesis anti-sigma factor FlgM [Pirellulaceae bacterium]|nr:flagellar biosynthesis anti-sigma factor FlgM [Pirellulaceae bacterium]